MTGKKTMSRSAKKVAVFAVAAFLVLTFDVAFLDLVSSSWALRIQEKRESATHVVIGSVLAVYEEQQEKPRPLLGYVVRIRIKEVKKGTGLAFNDDILVGCYGGNTRFPSNVPRHPGSAPYKYVPKKGEIIRAFVRHSQGRYEGVYPDWIDVLEAAKPVPRYKPIKTPYTEPFR